jgi:hypothetical protein
MKILSISLVTFTIVSHSECFSPSRQRHGRVTTPWSSRQPQVISSASASSCSSRFSSTALFGSADALLRMVEEVSEGQFSPQVVEKMSELEQALTAFLEEERAAQNNSNELLSPRPPKIPPPLQSFIRQEETREERGNSLIKAEKALETLRLRLHQEEETLRKAEEALRQSMEEQKVLRRAEEALEKSRAAAEERKVDAIRRTQEAVESAEKARKEQQAAEQLAREHGLVGGGGEASTSTGSPTSASRPTISLSSLGGNDVDDMANNGAEAPVSSDGPAGVPVLYDWIQYIDGSVTGFVKGSRNFKDGSKVSTSPVPNGARGGTVITTESGSQ